MPHITTWPHTPHRHPNCTEQHQIPAGACAGPQGCTSHLDACAAERKHVRVGAPQTSACSGSGMRARIELSQVGCACETCARIMVGREHAYVEDAHAVDSPAAPRLKRPPLLAVVPPIHQAQAVLPEHEETRDTAQGQGLRMKSRRPPA
eukprot:933267-Rhodomonas_salina.5